MKRLLVLSAVLFLPLSSAHALTWNGPLPADLGTSANPLQVQITNVKDFRPPSYCGFVPSFAVRWSGLSACAPVVTQKNIQSSLQQISNSLYEQNRLAQKAQQWGFINSLRPVYVPPQVVVIPQAPRVESKPVVEEEPMEFTAPAVKCKAGVCVWGDN